jgi:hypothetical protein
MGARQAKTQTFPKNCLSAVSQKFLLRIISFAIARALFHLVKP